MIVDNDLKVEFQIFLKYFLSNHLTYSCDVDSYDTYMTLHVNKGNIHLRASTESVLDQYQCRYILVILEMKTEQKQNSCMFWNICLLSFFFFYTQSRKLVWYWRPGSIIFTRLSKLKGSYLGSKIKSQQIWKSSSRPESLHCTHSNRWYVISILTQTHCSSHVTMHVYTHYIPVIAFSTTFCSFRSNSKTNFLVILYIF